MLHLLRACQEIAGQSSKFADPKIALEKMLACCTRAVGAESGSIFRLSLKESGYKAVATVGDCQHSLLIPFLKASQAGENFKHILEVLQSELPLESQRTSSDEPISDFVWPIKRGTVCAGAVVLTKLQAHEFLPEHQALAAVLGEQSLLLFEKQDTLELLNALQEPIDFRQPLDDFLDSLLILIADASGMPYIALRELQDDDLHCIALYGFRSPDIERFHLAPLADFPPFAQAIATGRTIAVRDLNVANLSKLRAKEDLGQIRSFVVVPVKVGTNIFGTLSFAAEIEYDYTDLELKSFEAIANAIGVSISNSRHYRLAHQDVYEFARVSAVMAVDEIAQAVRHEARNYLQTAKERLALLSRHVETRQPFDTIKADLTLIDKKLSETSLALDKIKQVTKPPEHEMRRVRVERVWHDAANVVSGRLDAHPKIAFHVKGSAEIDAFPDLLWHAFLNLLLNSIEAFKSRSTKSGRKIDVTIDPKSDSASHINIRYTDNATGIDPSKLKPYLTGGQRLVNDVFELGVTSKEEGSGYGLYLVRKILANHGGSIDLVNHRGGVTFDITLPKHYEEKL